MGGFNFHLNLILAFGCILTEIVVEANEANEIRQVSTSISIKIVIWCSFDYF